MAEDPEPGRRTRPEKQRTLEQNPGRKIANRVRRKLRTVRRGFAKNREPAHMSSRKIANPLTWVRELMWAGSRFFANPRRTVRNFLRTRFAIFLPGFCSGVRCFSGPYGAMVLVWCWYGVGMVWVCCCYGSLVLVWCWGGACVCVCPPLRSAQPNSAVRPELANSVKK